MNRFGLHGKLIAHPGQRDALAQILLDAAKLVSSLPGCEIYFVSNDEKDSNALYVTEVWKSEADHKASLQMPDVRKLIEKGRPMVAGFGESTRLVPIGGHGLRNA
jgi:quinol monooxygenase YgiN